MKRIGKIRCDAARSAAENARRALPRLAQAYFRLGRRILKEKQTFRSLHRLRLETKRFRYTLEVFAPIYGPTLEKRISALRQIQDQLGAINDRGATRRLLNRSLPKSSPTRRRLAGRLTTEAERQMQQFARHWRGVFDARGEEERWTDYLSRFAAGGPQRGRRGHRRAGAAGVTPAAPSPPDRT